MNNLEIKDYGRSAGKTREELETAHGQVWDTAELQRDYSVEGFGAPFVVVTRKSDGKKGSLEFQHSPRFYFGFTGGVMSTIHFELENDDGDIEEHDLPAKWEVCYTCRGRGSHVNRAIDGHGISREEFDEDPDFEEAYFSGRYDVMCEECAGRTTVLVIDEDECERRKLMPLVERYYRDARAAAADAAADRHTRMMESGGYGS